MKIILELIHTIYDPQKMVLFKKSQIALCGRSNVGKSSLINCLAKRKNLAKTSSVPGKTRSINFYNSVNHPVCLVDLPGYGYAACSKKEREKWPILIESYFKKNMEYIKGTILILDSRLEPQASDLKLLSFLEKSFEKQIPIVPVLTKVDRCKTSQLHKVKRLWDKMWDFNQPFILFSAKTSQGAKILWQTILNLSKE